MIKTRIVDNANGTSQLCETYSIDNLKLQQVETGIVYGSSVVDIIAGYDEHNLPYSRFTYIETEEYDINNEVLEATEADYISALNEKDKIIDILSGEGE
jgi:hypothetical protein